MENKFKAYDKVLIRHKYAFGWIPTFYSFYDEVTNKHVTLSGTVGDEDIQPFNISYENVQNDNNEIEDELVKENEYVIANTDIKYLREGCCGYLLRFAHINKKDGTIVCYDPSNDPCYGGLTGWHCILPLSKFDPKNIQESRKHILYVSNNKLTRYYK